MPEVLFKVFRRISPPQQDFQMPALFNQALCKVLKYLGNLTIKGLMLLLQEMGGLGRAHGFLCSNVYDRLGEPLGHLD